MEDWITTSLASALSGYSQVHIRRLVQSGEIIARKWGRDWQVSHKSLRDYMNRIKDKGKKRGPKPKN